MLYSSDESPAFTLSAGPVEAYPEVSLALARPILYDFDPAFMTAYERVARKAAQAMDTEEPPVILQGEPVLGLEAAAASLIAAEDVALNLVSGVYGKGYGYWAARYAREVVEIEVAYNEAIAVADVERMLAERPDITVVCVCHHETPSGTLNPIEAIGEAVARHGAYLIVDAVSSWAGMDISPASCRADVFVTGPSKCLGGTPATTLVAVSPQAWSKMEANANAPRASILSILDWRAAWRRDEAFPFTPSVAEINGLEAALDRYLGEGRERVWQRHALTAAACRAGVQALGLELWPARESIASPTTTSVRVPDGVADAELRAQARARYGVTFSAGRDATAGQLIRIGHMGPTAQPIYAVLAVAALAGAAGAVGLEADAGAAVQAAMAVIDSAQA